METKLLLALDIDSLKDRALIAIKTMKLELYKYYLAYSSYPELKPKIRILINSYSVLTTT